MQLPMTHNGEVWKDLLYGVRALRRSPVFTAAAVLSLALGIGANTAIFSLLNQVVLRSLPIANPERLVAVHGSYSGPGDSSSSWSTNSESVFPYPFYRDLRDRDPAFAGMLAAPVSSVFPGMGNQVLILCFVVVVIGGIGSVWGALVAALLIGFADTFGKVLFPDYAGISVYLLMAAILLWRPEGLFKRV